jgi:hypothetical protein
VFALLFWQPLEEQVKVKLAQFCHVSVTAFASYCKRTKNLSFTSCDSNAYIGFFCQIPNIINLPDVTNIWHIPLLLRVSLIEDSYASFPNYAYFNCKIPVFL